MMRSAARPWASWGVGRIGRAVTRLAKPFGMRVIGCNRTIRDEPDIERVYDFAGLREFLGACDFVAVCAALAPETAGLIGAAEFAAMRPSAVLINVGRGEVVVEDALYDALKTRPHRRCRDRCLVPLSERRRPQHDAVAPSVPRAAQSADDAAFLGLDARHGRAPGRRDGR
ncbi:MAG: NAD(P)-dependent oxidoreductase [Pseudomonadota bacterium]